MADDTKPTVRGKPKPVEQKADDVDALMPTLGAGDSPSGGGAIAAPTPEKTTEELLSELRKPFDERLEVTEKIGAGGMGTIEAVLDRALRRTIARKSIHPSLSAKERAMFLFVREARITSQLDHPNIVPVHHLGEGEKGSLYFLMKRVQGAPLSETLEELPSGQLYRSDLVDILSIILKVCDALAFAHSRGVLHCDIKPANIMVGAYGEVYLMDWGIARVLDSSVPDVVPLEGVEETSVGLSSGIAMGTPNFMSPEQASGKREDLDERSDVFAIGAILYQILAGRPPYSGATTAAVLGKAQAAMVGVPAEVRGALVPLELQRIALKAMSRDRRDRYRTVRHLEKDLRNYLYLGGDFPTAVFKPGDHILHEGDRGYSVYIIERGQCRAYRNKNGENMDLAILGPGDVFGETAILADVPRTASVVAIEETSVYVVTREVMENELADVKPWLARLVRALAERFRDERARNQALETAMKNDKTLM